MAKKGNLTESRGRSGQGSPKHKPKSLPHALQVRWQAIVSICFLIYLLIYVFIYLWCTFLGPGRWAGRKACHMHFKFAGKQ